MGISTEYKEYINTLHAQFRQYRKSRFPDDNLFDHRDRHSLRVRVFGEQHKLLNLLVHPDTTPECILESAAPNVQFDRWFSSMSSSQALTMSIFANLKYHNKLGLLASLEDDDGNQLFPISDATQCQLEYAANYLGEMKFGRTSTKVFFDGDYRIAVECKFTKPDMASCPRTRLNPRRPSFCDGTYTIQRGRDSRCSLSCLGIHYWQYVPSVFEWASDVDHNPCPLRETYQFVQSILAACVKPDGTPNASDGHAVLLYDERNPRTMHTGKAMCPWDQTKHGLQDKSRLRKCTWQQLVEVLRTDKELNWLTDALNEKYGL